MNFRRTAQLLPAALGLALNLPGVAVGQGPGVSSGSGSGTGTGSSAGSGFNSTGTGMQSGAGNSTGTGSESASGTDSNSLGPFSGPAGRTPGGSLVTLPSDGMRPIPGLEVSSEEISKIDARLLSQARSVTDPADRALVLQRIASTKIIFRQRLGDAHIALVEAADAARQMPASELRDRRLISVVETLLSLAEAEVRLGMQPADVDIPPNDPANPDITPPAEGTESGGPRWLDKADDEWARADRAAGDITNPNFRGQQHSRVAESRALGASQLAGESGIFLDEPTPSEKPRTDRDQIQRADGILDRAIGDADRIDFPVWRDHALELVATKASHAGRFSQALGAARRVGRPEIRVDALVRVAEDQVRRNLPDDATRTYTETARAVSSIPSDDPRMVLAGILIDSLISMGRFDDARASVNFIAKPYRRLDALGAVAESQGRRGLGDAAMTWIERDMPDSDRPILRRRVTDGMLATVEQYRTNNQNIDRDR